MPVGEVRLVAPFSRIPWPERTFEATCDRYRHAAPADGCSCGIYGAESPLEIRWQVRMMARMLASGMPCPTQPFLVVGRVELQGAVPLYDEADAVAGQSQNFPVLLATDHGRDQLVLRRVGDNTYARPSRCVEMRARSARITDLYLPDDGMERVWPAGEVVELLAEAYGVPVQVGEPAYTLRAWDDKLLPETRYLQVGLRPP
jgi:hypothetical protein